MSDEYRKIFVRKLAYYMQLNGKKQIDLMHDLGLKSATVSSWCTGKKLPRVDKIQLLADYFHIEKSDLLEDKITDNKETFARNLKRLMEENGKSRTDICKALNIKYTTLTDWLNAKTYPRIDALQLLANYFHVSKADLVEELSNNSLGNKIKSYRIMNDLSQADLGKKLFTSGACISSWERGRTEPSLDQIKAIAEIFNIPVEDFISTAGQANDITTDELDIIYAYRNASPEIKEVINKLLKYSKRINELDKLLK